MKTSSIWRMSLLSWVMFLAFDFLGGWSFQSVNAAESYSIFWGFAANAIVAVTVSLLAARAPWRGVRLALAVAAVPVSIHVINAIEGAVYLKLDGAMLWAIAFPVFKYALIVPLWLMFFRRPENLPSSGAFIAPRTWCGKLWRFILCVVIYLFLYLAAGMLVFPLIRDFYATQHIPSFALIVVLQVLVRGPVFIGICVLLSFMVGAQRLTTALAVGVAFALLSGVAPLIVPNPCFPDAVRWIHLSEVTISNFVFGVLVSLMWLTKRNAQQLVPATV